MNRAVSVGPVWRSAGKALFPSMIMGRSSIMINVFLAGSAWPSVRLGRSRKGPEAIGSWSAENLADIPGLECNCLAFVGRGKSFR